MLLLMSPILTIACAFIIGGSVSLTESGHDIWAGLLPILGLVALIILLKLAYKMVDYLIRKFFW